jgi:hypothetical protein
MAIAEKVNMTEFTVADASLTTILAVWGALLSTVLAGVKLWEVWQARFRVEVVASLTGSEEIGNTVSIRNLAGKPAILGYWEILRISGRWPFWKEKCLVSPDEGARDTSIAPHSTLSLPFIEGDHFAWGPAALQGDRIFMRLHFAGRRPILREVVA